ncbi:MAG: hypothetical protein AAF355_14565 [Myxococcota bacterium]
MHPIASVWKSEVQRLPRISINSAGPNVHWPVAVFGKGVGGCQRALVTQMHRVLLSIMVGLFSISCGSSRVTPASISVGRLTFEPSSSLRRVPVDCLPREYCSALDDDCDGRVDEGCSGVDTVAGSLPEADLDSIVHVAWNSSASFGLVFRKDGSSENLPPFDCRADPHVLRLPRPEVPGIYELVLYANPACGSDELTTVSVVVETDDGVLGPFTTGPFTTALSQAESLTTESLAADAPAEEASAAVGSEVAALNGSETPNGSEVRVLGRIIAYGPRF